MKSKFRKGSMGAAEEKAERNFKIGASVVILLVFLSMYVFNTQLKDNTKAASTFQNVLGLVGFGVSLGSLWLADKFSWFPGKVAKVTLIVGLVLGVLVGGGFIG